jgi:hypothetical protein
MPVDVSPLAQSDVAVVNSLSSRALDPLVEDRWTAWVAAGRRHDAAVRRKVRIVGIAAVITAALLGLLALGGVL